MCVCVCCVCCLTIAHNHAGALADGVDGYLEGEVVRDEDHWLSLLGVRLRVAQQEADIVPAPISQFLGIPVCRVVR